MVKVQTNFTAGAFLYFMFLFLMIASCKKEDNAESLRSPVSAEDVLSTFQLAPGFKIELIAAEPLIADPVAMEIDENGNLYVVENHGYPLDKTKSSKIKLLRDTNGDGRMDKSTVFADTLMMPTGVMRWKRGILVTDAPDLLYLEDTDADGIADSIHIMLTGFALSNPQHNVNSPIMGLDNWIYLAHERTVGSEVYKKEFGDRGTEIYYPSKPGGKRLSENANGRNIRLRPDQHDIEVLSSTSQFGHTFDAWGNHLLVNNSNHLMHSVIGAEYLSRNLKLIVPRSTASLPDHGNAAEVYPITKKPDRQLLTDAGVMTSACAITAYSGGAFPEDYNTNTTFVAEPVSNIIHADRISPHGSTFIASRRQTRSEFLASTDMWSRPVNMYIGPDGALYVVDYYREIIEHPEWLADEVINSGKLYNGHDMGRIYRISKNDSKNASWTTSLKLTDAEDTSLIEHLADDNIWWRRTAQRLLIDRNVQDIGPLVKMLKNQEKFGRLHALWTLEGLKRLTIEDIAQALNDPEPGMRTNAIKLAELHLNDAPTLAENLLRLQDDSDAKVRFQLLLTLGFINSPEAEQARMKLLFQDIRDEFVQVAALSATGSADEKLLPAVLTRYDNSIPAYATLVKTLSAIAASEGKISAYQLLREASAVVDEKKMTWHVPMLKGFAQGVSNRKSPLSVDEQNILFTNFFAHSSLEARQAMLEILQAKKLPANARIDPSIQKARHVAANQNIGERERALAITFLGLKNPVAHGPFLKQTILSQETLPIRLAALKTLNEIPDETISTFVLEHWDGLDPALQDAALNAFMEKETRVRLLVDAIESGKVQQTSVGWHRSIRLMVQSNISLRNRARALFAKDMQREKVILDYQPALTLNGDITNGQAVYQKSCALCHQVKGVGGIPFGPDLGTIQSWPASGILANILDPNQSVSHGFDLWNVTLKNGDSWQGIIASETPSAITVRNASGQVNTIAREQIASQNALHLSAMPIGLEKDISHQQMADLLAFLTKSK